MSYEINRRDLIRIGAGVALAGQAGFAVTDTPHAAEQLRRVHGAARALVVG